MVALRLTAAALLCAALLAGYAGRVSAGGGLSTRPVLCWVKSVPLRTVPSLSPALADLEALRFDEALRHLQEVGPALHTTPIELLTDSLDRMDPSVRRAAAAWLADWMRGAGPSVTPEQACDAGLFVSEFLSPQLASERLEEVVARHPDAAEARCALATVLLHRAAGLEPGEPGRGQLIRRAERILEEAESRTSGPDRSGVRLARVDLLAFAGRYRSALRLYEELESHHEIDPALRERGEREWEAGILALHLGDAAAARLRFQRSSAAQDQLATRDSDLLTATAALTVASRYAFLGDPVTEEDVRELEGALAQGPHSSSEPLLGLPRDIRSLATASPSQLGDLARRMEDLEARYSAPGELPPCLTVMTHYRPVVTAIAHKVRGEALHRLGRHPEAAAAFQAAAVLFPGAPALAGASRG